MQIEGTVESIRQLTKGANVKLRDLDAELGGLTVVLETGDTIDGDVIDADVSLFLLGADKRVRSNDDFVFYNQPASADGAVHLRDKIRRSSTSAAVVTLNLDAVPDDVERVLLVASLDISTGRTFADTLGLRLLIQRTDDGSDLVSFEIEDASTERAMLFGEFYRREGLWRFRAVGQGYAGGLEVAAHEYGIDVATDASESGDDEGDEGQQNPALVTEPDPAQSGGEERVSVRRQTRPPRMPDDWNRTMPAPSGSDLIRARLFPIAASARVMSKRDARRLRSLPSWRWSESSAAVSSPHWALHQEALTLTPRCRSRWIRRRTAPTGTWR